MLKSIILNIKFQNLSPLGQKFDVFAKMALKAWPFDLKRLLIIFSAQYCYSCGKSVLSKVRSSFWNNQDLQITSSHNSNLLGKCLVPYFFPFYSPMQSIFQRQILTPQKKKKWENEIVDCRNPAICCKDWKDKTFCFQCLGAQFFHQF